MKHVAVVQTLSSLAVLSLGVACGSAQEQDSNTKITNGIVIPASEHPAVVALDLIGYYSSGKCTGTFINDSQVLTAAHCVQNKNYVRTVIDGRTVDATKYTIHPDYSWLPNPEKSSADIAIVEFPAGTSSNFIPLASDAPLAGDQIRIVGYGNTKVHNTIDYTISPWGGFYSTGLTTSGGDGQKRLGMNSLDRRENGELVFVGEFETQAGREGVNSGAAQGDSGGPMLVAVDGTWNLVGVTSMGRVKDETYTEVRDEDGTVRGKILIGHVETVYVDLSSARAQNFLTRHIEATE